MTHDAFKEKLLLYVYDDLDPEHARAISEHLRNCAECASEVQRLRKLHSALDAYRPPVSVDDRLLNEARQQLHTALVRERFRQTAWERLRSSFDAVLAPRYQLALGGIAAIAAGVLIGRYLLVPTSPSPAFTPQAQIPQDAHITNVRFLTSTDGTGIVEFTFDAVTPVRMKGSVDDPQIQRVLTHAILNEENPGVRLRAVSAIASPGTEPPDREVKAALIIALKSDANAGVRKEALQTLQRFPPDSEIKDALLHTLMYDKNPGLRIAAINGLDSLRVRGGMTGQDLLRVLRNRMQTDENNYIRLRARAVLQEVTQQ
jgi:CheY-like chemotaxis protein